MKTLSDYIKDRREEKRIATETINRQNREWLASVEKKEIPVYQGNSESKDSRELLRDKIRNESSGLTRIEIACDHCHTELVRYDAPTYTSFPPKKKISCIGCGWSGYMIEI